MSSYRFVAGIPNQNNDCGLWIDGERRKIGSDLTCIYISDKTEAVEIDVSPKDYATFLNDMRELEAFLFIKKWILKPIAG